MFREWRSGVCSVFLVGCVLGLLVPKGLIGGQLMADGKTNTVIVVGSDVPDSVKLAADELQSHMEQVTGVKAPIQYAPADDDGTINIFVGPSSHTEQLGITVEGLKPEGFRIVARDNWVVILGRDHDGPVVSGVRNPWQYHEVYSPKWKIGAFGEAGTLYGVYEFLRQACGIRWYMPGPLGVVVPQADRLEIGELDICRAPDFEYRYPWLCNFSQTDDEPIWFRRVGFGGVAPVQIMHSFCEFLKYKDSHPDYFALIDGQRDFTDLSTAFPVGNLCLSNPQVANQWIEDICAYFDSHPEQRVYPLAPNDGMHRVCECPACQAQVDHQAADRGRFSNYVWAFVDKVARGVAKRHPDRYVGCIAYEQYLAPPTCIDKLSPNVAVMLCKLRVTYYDGEQWKQDRRKILEWKRKAEVLYIWEYYLQSWLPWRNLPTPFPHIIGADLKGLKGVIRGEFIESESWYAGDLPVKMNFPGMQHLNLYVTARAYWDADLDVDGLLSEYFRLFYGPAEGQMKAYWLSAEEYWMNQDTAEPRVGFGGGDPVKVFTPQRLKHLVGLLESAKAQTTAESVYRRRIDLIAAEFAHAVRDLTNDLVVNPPEVTIASTAGKAVTLDGKIDDALWKTREPMAFVDKGGNQAAYATKAYVTWDDEYLYFAFENLEPEMDELRADATERDQSVDPPLWDEDGVEMFICPDPGNRKVCYQFIVNARGVVWDAARGVSEEIATDRSWNGGIETASHIQADRWVVEVKIPWADMGIRCPLEGRTIAINMFRNRNCGGPLIYSCWSPTLDSGHWTPSRFGLMTFQR